MSGIFDALGEPARRVILELLGPTERRVGDIVEGIQSRAPMSQPAVSQHLRVLLEAGLVRVRADGTRRYYSLDHRGIAAAQAWLGSLVDPLEAFGQPLDALATEVARGRKAQRKVGQAGGELKDRNSRPA